MSYDLAVFEPEAAPKNRAEFLAWFERQTKWDEPHGYDDPAVSTSTLRSWFMDIIKEFPPMNGPYAGNDLVDIDDSHLTDYSVGTSLIYAAFAWSLAELAYTTMFRLAEKHRIGFFNVSSDTGEVCLPDAAGKLVVAHRS